jgi:hypothetical protein
VVSSYKPKPCGITLGLFCFFLDNFISPLTTIESLCEVNQTELPGNSFLQNRIEADILGSAQWGLNNYDSIGQLYHDLAPLFADIEY